MRLALRDAAPSTTLQRHHTHMRVAAAAPRQGGSRPSLLAPLRSTPRRGPVRKAPVCGASAASLPADSPEHPSSTLAQLAAAAGAFASAQFLPLLLLSALTLGYCLPELGVAASGMNAPVVTTTGIFIIQGLSLRRGEAIAALQCRGAVAYGLASILLITPLMGMLALQAPLQPPALAIGLAVFCCMPTALSSGVTFTQQIGGNVALALLLTLGSNLLGIFTIPFTLPAVLGDAGGAVRLSPWPLLKQLVTTILLPTLLGASIRGFVPGAAALVDANKRPLAYASAALLAMVPWMQVSRAVAQRAAIEAVHVAAAAVLGIFIHLSFLTLNALACRVLSLGGPDPATALRVRQALVLTASVKTLPVAVTVLGSMGPLLGDAVGIAAVPCVLAHLGQILTDSFLVSLWRAREEKLA